MSGGSPLDTVLIDVRVVDPSPEQAAELADAVAASLVDVVTDLESPATGEPSSVRLSVVEAALVPTDPVSPNAALNALLGLVVGLGLAVGAVVAWDALDTRVRSAEQASEALGAPVLTALQADPDMGERWMVSHETGFSSQAEALRRLRTNLQFLDVRSQRRSFVITSSVAGEGKTTVSVNLALTVAAAGMRVVLVDADLRRPRVADYLRTEGSVGLTTVLIGRAEVRDVLQVWGPHGSVDFIASGEIPPNPSELLGSAEMERLIRSLEAEYDVVLIDSPPSLPVTDPSILAAMCAGAIVVVSAGIARRDQLGVVKQSLEAAGATLLGVVANRLKASGSSYGGYGAYAQEYGSVTPPSRSSGASPAAWCRPCVADDAGGRADRARRPGRRRAAREQAVPALDDGADHGPVLLGSLEDRVGQVVVDDLVTTALGDDGAQRLELAARAEPRPHGFGERDQLGEGERPAQQVRAQGEDGGAVRPLRRHDEVHAPEHAGGQRSRPVRRAVQAVLGRRGRGQHVQRPVEPRLRPGAAHLEVRQPVAEDRLDDR